MKKEEIHLWDIKCILFGQAPPAFMLEVFVRLLVLYLIAIIVLRWMGKRMNGEHTIVELAVMVMMGAIISLPLQTPDRRLVPAFIIAAVVVLLGRQIAALAYRKERFEARVEDKLTILLNDGVLDLQKLEGTVMSKE